MWPANGYRLPSHIGLVNFILYERKFVEQNPGYRDRQALDNSGSSSTIATMTMGFNHTPVHCDGLFPLHALDTAFLRGKPNVLALLGIVGFYFVILILGILGSWWGRRANRHLDLTEREEVMLGGRNISRLVGVFTMTATWVGGGYINGTAENIFSPESGLVWTQAPLGYALSLTLGGALFAKKMREKDYVTMLDPFEARYGSTMAALLYIPALLGDVFWTAAVLSALGGSFSVVIGLNDVWAVAMSVLIAMMYTFIGGLYSVAYTDIVQLICIFVGLWLVIPYAMMHPAVKSITETAHASTVNGTSWVGNPPESWQIGQYLDSLFLMTFGGIPWQAYFQRVLSQRNARSAMIVSFVAGFGCIVMAVPAAIIGAIAYSTDWNATDYREFGEIPVPACDYPLALPMVMHYLTPTLVAVIGLGAVSAAVMSSVDSSVLSASTMFAQNVYVPLRDAIAKRCSTSKATEPEITRVARVTVLLIGLAAFFLAIIVRSVYDLWLLCSDLIYVVLFPQLLCVIHMPFTNVYGSLAGFITGIVLRFLGGEPLIGLAPVIEYPWYDAQSGNQLFPFKTLTMLLSLAAIIIFSIIACKPCVCLDKALSNAVVQSPATHENGNLNLGFVDPDRQVDESEL